MSSRFASLESQHVVVVQIAVIVVVGRSFEKATGAVDRRGMIDLEIVEENPVEEKRRRDLRTEDTVDVAFGIADPFVAAVVAAVVVVRTFAKHCAAAYDAYHTDSQVRESFYQELR